MHIRTKPLIRQTTLCPSPNHFNGTEPREDIMQVSVNTHIVIHHPPDRVFAWLTAINKLPLWGGNLVSMEQISAGLLQVGSQIRQVTNGGRKLSESIVEVTEYVPGQRFGIKGSNLEGTFTLEPFQAGTRLNARFEVEATGLIAFLYRVMLNQFVLNDLHKFKKLVESTEVTGM
jgi:uncharacterized protein YndB with AHSA1/START domain